MRFWIAIAAAGCWTSSPPPDPPAPPTPVNTIEHKLGTFRIPKADRARRGTNTIAMPGVERFRYDGKHVTLRLFTEKEWMWRRPDDTYRLEAHWNGNELQYRPPFGRWTPLATFTAGHYELADETRPWVFEYVTEAMKDPDDRVLDAERPPHDYSIKPMDRYSP